ncbi:LAQU0S13e00826g1_1 [Lachancea quebecensis]|uniref:LAQU0S13e00826g1_1 n=1 Tax=Lachancea quebecensis TaxID=1654605 RepID=A0A0N7MM35_9SACH|nr:LAQU0S13e00826g1_1 [Lachancea quebecensis]
MSVLEDELPTATSEDFGFKPLGKIDILPSCEEQLPFSKLQNFAISNTSKLYAAASNHKVIVGTLHNLRDQLSDVEETGADSSGESKQLQFLSEKDLECVVYVGFNSAGTTVLCITRTFELFQFDVLQKEWSSLNISSPSAEELTVTSVKPLSPDLQTILVQASKHLYQIEISGTSSVIASDITDFDVGYNQYVLMQGDGTVQVHENFQTQSPKIFTPPNDILEQITEEFAPLAINVLSELHYLVVFGNPITESDEDVVYDHKMYLVTLTENNEAKFQESFDIAPAFGSVLRNPNYYRISLDQLMPSVPHLYIISSAASSELTLLDDHAVIQPSQDSDRAVLPINQDTDNDTNPVGMAIDLTSELRVPEPCQGVSVSSNLPIVFVLNSEGEVLVFALFNSSGIKNNEFSAETALNALQKEWKISEEVLNIKSKIPMVNQKDSLGNSINSRPATGTSTGISTDVSGSNSSSSFTQPSSPSVKSDSPQSYERQQKSTSPPGQPALEQPSFGKSSSGQPSFGQSSFGKTSFGQSPFGQSATEKSPFGQPSFGQAAFGKPTFEKTVAGQQDFGKPTFGQSTFGQSTFGNLPVGVSATEAAKPSESQTPASELGQEAVSGVQNPSSQPIQPKPTFGNISFGQPTSMQTLSDNTMSSPDASSFGKPAFGKPAFGSGLQFGTSNIQTDSESVKKNGYASGQPAFKAPIFGAPAFGTPAFGQTPISGHGSKSQATGTEKPTAPGFGAFSAFAKTDSPFSKLSSGPSPFVDKPSAEDSGSKESGGQGLFGNKHAGSSSTEIKPVFGTPPTNLFNKAVDSNNSPTNASENMTDSNDNASSLFSSFNKKISEHKQLQSPFSQFQNSPATSVMKNVEITTNDENRQGEDSDSSSGDETSTENEGSSTENEGSSTESVVDNQSQSDNDEKREMAKESSLGGGKNFPKEQNIFDTESNKTDFSSLTERIKKVANVDTNSFSDAFSKSMAVKDSEASQTGTSAFSKFSKDLQKSPTSAFSFANIGKQQSLNDGTKTTNYASNSGFPKLGHHDTEKDGIVGHEDTEKSNEIGDQSAEKEEGTSAALNKNEESSDYKGTNKNVFREEKPFDSKLGNETSESNTRKPSTTLLPNETTDEYSSSGVNSKEASKEASEESPVNLSDSGYSAKRTETSTGGESFDDLDDLKEELEHIKTQHDDAEEPATTEHISEPAFQNLRLVQKSSPTEAFDAETQTSIQSHDVEVETEKKTVGHADVQAFENDEKYLAQQYAPKKIGTFFIGAKLSQKPSLSKNETMKRIEATFNIVSSELEVLQCNLETIGEFINDQSKKPFTRTIETLFLNYTWRLEEASLLNSFIEDVFGEEGSIFTEASSLMCDAENVRDKDLVSLKNNQFSTREYFCQLKTLCEQNEVSKRGLTFRQTQFQRKLRSKISSVQNLIQNIEGTLRVLKAQASSADVDEKPLVSTLIDSSLRRGDLLEAIQALRSEVAELKLRDRGLVKFSDTNSATRTAPISELKLKLDTKQQIGQVLMNRLQST